MFKDNDTQQFLFYTMLLGILIVLVACIILLCLMPGSEDTCKIPFLTEEEVESQKYVYESEPELIILTDTNYEAIIKTEKGDIRIDLFEENAPTTVNNFVFLAKEGYFDGIKIHRVFQDFLFQTGSRNSLDDDPSNDGYGGPGYVIKDEINWDSLDLPEKKREVLTELGYVNAEGVVSKVLKKYSVAMANARQGNTNGSQFFIVTADDQDTRLLSLGGEHTVFGEVIDGFDVVEEINNIKVEDDDPNNPYPKKPLIITSIDVLEIKNGAVTVDGEKSGLVNRDQTVRVDEN